MESEQLEQVTANHEPERPKTLAEKLHPAMEAAGKLVAKFNNIHEARLAREKSNQQAEPGSANPS